MSCEIAKTGVMAQNDASNPWLWAGLLIAFLLSALGWGFCFRRIFPTPLLRLRSMTVVAGLAFLNVIGGWLNVLGLATTPFFIALLSLGLVFLGVQLPQTFRRRKSPGGSTGQRLLTFAPLIIALPVVLLTASVLIPTSVFNVQDDFQAYVPRAVRMIQTGTLGGSPFDTVGLDSLGAQTFFHGFFLPNLDVRMLQMFDSVGCFGLALFLVGELAVRWRIPVIAGALAVLAVVAINPQNVNISPLYSGVVAVMALVVCGTACAPRVASATTRRGISREVFLGLVAGLIIALKAPLAWFAAIYLAVLYVLLWFSGAPRGRILKSAFVVASVIALAVLPWILVHVPTILRARDLALPFITEAPLLLKYPSLASHDIPQLWSSRVLNWGDSIPSYHFVVFVCLTAGLVGASFWWVNRGYPHTRGLLSITAAGIAVLGSYLWNAHLFEVDDAIRYSLPPLIASAPIGLMCLLKFSWLPRVHSSRALTVGACCVMLAVVCIFGKTLGRRSLVAADSRTTLAYPLSARYLDYCARATSRSHQQQARAFQQKMEPGATVLVSAAAPFQFDFVRNRLLTASEAGLMNPAIRFPAGIGPEALRRYLRNHGIRYVFFQRDGEGIKTIEALRPHLTNSNVIFRKLADYGIYFRESMTSLAAQSEILFENDRILLFDLDRIATAPPK
jgi:hypothetical protein